MGIRNMAETACTDARRKPVQRDKKNAEFRVFPRVAVLYNRTMYLK